MKRSFLIIGAVFIALFAVGTGIAVMSGSDDQTASSTGQTEDSASTQGSQTEAEPNTIVLDGNGFSPNQLSVKIGDTVTFVNRDSENHWPASNDHPSHKKYPELDPKKPIKPSESWSFTFTREGQWGMHDHLFPTDRATITVELTN